MAPPAWEPQILVFLNRFHALQSCSLNITASGPTLETTGVEVEMIENRKSKSNSINPKIAYQNDIVSLTAAA